MTPQHTNAIFPPRITTTRTIIIMNNSGSNNENDNEEESVGGSAMSSVDVSTMDSSLTCRGTKKRKSTMLMSHDDLVSYFEMRLDAILLCPNQSCDCIAILRNKPLCSAIASYLAWFERRSKYEQDAIVLQWVIYKKILPGSNMNWYHVPFDGSCYDDDDDEDLQQIRNHLLCTAGIQAVMGIGYRRMKTIRNAATFTTIMPFSGNHGKPSHAEMKADDPRAAPLKHHMEYLLNLGEVRATRVVATLVDGVQQGGHENREDTVDMVYLPISMGYRSCYKRYMNSLGFQTRCTPKGVIIVDGTPNEGGGKETKGVWICFIWEILQLLEEELLSIEGEPPGRGYLSVLLCFFKSPQVLCQSHHGARC